MSVIRLLFTSAFLGGCVVASTAPSFAQIRDNRDLSPPTIVRPATPQSQISTAATQNRAAPIANVSSPDASRSWVVFPVRVGQVGLMQKPMIHMNMRDKASRVRGYSVETQTLEIFIFNPGLSAANPQIACGNVSVRPTGPVGVITAGSGRLYTIRAPDSDMRGDARCTIIADRPVIVKAVLTNRIEEVEPRDDSDGRASAGYPISNTKAEWPVMRRSSE